MSIYLISAVGCQTPMAIISEVQLIYMCVRVQENTEKEIRNPQKNEFI